jgi:hypothetical protein
MRKEIGNTITAFIRLFRKPKPPVVSIIAGYAGWILYTGILLTAWISYRSLAHVVPTRLTISSKVLTTPASGLWMKNLAPSIPFSQDLLPSNMSHQQMPVQSAQETSTLKRLSEIFETISTDYALTAWIVPGREPVPLPQIIGFITTRVSGMQVAASNIAETPGISPTWDVRNKWRRTRGRCRSERTRGSGSRHKVREQSVSESSVR